jgi:hypothetical protein
MAIVGMLGFDEFPNGTFSSVNLNPMLPGMGGTEGKYSLFILGSYWNGTWVALPLASLGDTEVSTSVQPQMITTSVNVANNLYVIKPPYEVTATDLDKTGKWHFGVMVQVPSTANPTSSLGVLGDGTVANNVYFGNYGSNYDNGQIATGQCYMEITIDWAAKMLYGYVNGILRGQKSFTTAPVVGIGNFTTTPYANSADAKYMQVSAVSTAYVLRFSNIYFAIDPLNDPNPTGRLGPCRIRNTPVVSVDTTPNMVTTDGTGSFVTPLNKQYAATVPIITDFITLDPYGSEATIHFQPPTLTANSDKIIAVQPNIYAMKPLESSATEEIAFANGTTELSRKTIPVVNLPTLQFSTINRAKDGTALVPASIADVTIKAKSHRN